MRTSRIVMSVRRSARVSSRPVPAAVPIINSAQSRKRSAEAAPISTVIKKTKKVIEDAQGVSQRPDGPSTPVRKRKATVTKVPPVTPTPSMVNIMRAPYSTGDIDDAPPAPTDRPVDPYVTNATLVTPGGTRSTAVSSTHFGTSSSVTTGTLLEKACAHLISVDPRLQLLIEKNPCPVFSPEGLAEQIDPFRSLSTGIMGQQVSGAAATAIKNKFVALFNEQNDGSQAPVFPTPAQVAITDITRLRLAGLSQRKAEYIQGLAQKFVGGELTNQMLLNASDEEVMEKLIAVRGLGKWSVEMFACFGLKRMDILSTGDLGVQRGMAHFFGRDVSKLKAKGGGKWKYMSEQDMCDKSAPFAPFRSLFMWYMWRVADVDIDFTQPT